MPTIHAATAARNADRRMIAVPLDRERAAVLATVKSQAHAPAFGRS
jgi:hypothetical protein